MGIVKRLRKRRKAAHRLDLSSLREALKDRRCWTCLAVVTVAEGKPEHWALRHDEDGKLVDVLVDVVTQPSGQELLCRLGGMSSTGTLTIPKLGDEVLVCLPDGLINFMPVIVALLGSNDLPDPGGDQGIAPSRTLIVNSEVLVHDGTGTAKKLATLEDLESHKTHYDGHSHHQWGYPGGTVDSGALVSTSAPTKPAGAAPGNIPDPAPAPTGTTVLKGQ